MEFRNVTLNRIEINDSTLKRNQKTPVFNSLLLPILITTSPWMYFKSLCRPRHYLSLWQTPSNSYSHINCSWILNREYPERNLCYRLPMDYKSKTELLDRSFDSIIRILRSSPFVRVDSDLLTATCTVSQHSAQSRYKTPNFLKI